MANITTDQINQLRTLLEQTKGVLVTIPKNPTLDSMAAALSLYLTISARGKQATVVTPDPVIVEFSHLVGIDKVKNNLNNGTGKNLVISFPYQEGSIEKVSYNIENGAFNLIIEPREGYPLITPENIQYSYSGGNIDLIFTIGVTRLAELDTLYQNNQALFHNSSVVNLDSHSHNQRFGRVNLVDPTVSSLSELTVALLSQLGLEFDPDIALNLLAGITNGSQNFTSGQTTADTFEAAAICLRFGGKRVMTSTPPAFSLPQTFLQKIPTQSFTKPPVSHFPPEEAISPTKIAVGAKSQPVKPTIPPPKIQKQTSSPAPADWLKPKIYKGSTLL